MRLRLLQQLKLLISCLRLMRRALNRLFKVLAIITIIEAVVMLSIYGELQSDLKLHQILGLKIELLIFLG